MKNIMKKTEINLLGYLIIFTAQFLLFLIVLLSSLEFFKISKMFIESPNAASEQLPEIGY